jgi:hypothetical protein
MEHSKIVVISASVLDDTGIGELIRDLDRQSGPRLIVVTPNFGHHMPIPVCALLGVNMLTEHLLVERLAINRAPEIWCTVNRRVQERPRDASGSPEGRSM